MTLTPNGRTLCWLGAAFMLLLAVWSLGEGPSLAEDTLVLEDATSPTVQCVAVLGGVQSEPETGQLTSFTSEEVADEEISGAVHETASIGDDLDLSEGSGLGSDDDPEEVSATNQSLDSVRDRIALCDRARDERLAWAGALLVPGLLLAAVALCATPVPGPAKQREPGDDVKRAGA